MWKKLFYNASKMVANDVSREYAKDKKKQLLQNKEQGLAEQERRQIIAEYQQDYERQQEVKEIDERLAYLIDTNGMCNNCLFLLERPFERLDIVDAIINNIENLRPRTLELLDSAEFENDYYQQIIMSTVTPFLNVSNLMFGDSDDEDSNGILGFFALYGESESDDIETLENLLISSIEFITDAKNQIREVFEETKKVQVVQYVAYDITGEVDFGIYTVDDLD